MSKITSKIALPIILVGLFAIAVFIALDYQQISVAFYAVILIFTVYVFFFGFAIGQDFSSPIKKILDRATDLSKGNLSSRVYLETKDELAELAKVFNKIAEELQASQKQGEDAEKSVGIKVKAKTQELEETMSALEQKVKNRTIELERLINDSGAMEADIRSKEAEIIQLRRDLESFKKKIVKPKKTVVKNNNEKI